MGNQFYPLRFVKFVQTHYETCRCTSCVLHCCQASYQSFLHLCRRFVGEGERKYIKRIYTMFPISQAMRVVSTFVFPLPAPATIIMGRLRVLPLPFAARSIPSINHLHFAWNKGKEAEFVKRNVIKKEAKQNCERHI